MEGLIWQVFLNSVGAVVAIATSGIVALWAYSEITYLKNKIKGLK